MFFRDLFQLFFWGGRDIELLTPRYASMYGYSGDSHHHKHLKGNVGEDGRRSAQQWRYRLHLMHIMEVSMIYNGLAVVSAFLLL